MNKAILRADVQQFINDNLNTDPAKIALGKSPFPDVSPAELAEQIDSEKRCEKKLPTWFNTPGIYYPPKLAIEQTSSELTAEYKIQLVNGKNVADLTGGFGVDSYSFSKVADWVAHCEINPDLSEISKYNAAVLRAGNIEFVRGDGLDYLRDSDRQIDTVYIDPSRRIKTQKVFFFKDCEPNVPANLHTLLANSQRLIVKASPLLDISSGLKELAHVSQIHVISAKNEVKELLWIIDFGFEGKAEIVCASLLEPIWEFCFYQSDEKTASTGTFSQPLTYLFEPDAAMLKAGCFKLIASRFKVFKLEKNTHLYTSEEKRENFPGKVFRVNKVLDYKSFSKSPLLKKANIVSKNFPLSTAELKKKHKLEDGGEEFLFFTRTAGNKLTVIYAQKA